MHPGKCCQVERAMLISPMFSVSPSVSAKERVLCGRCYQRVTRHEDPLSPPRPVCDIIIPSQGTVSLIPHLRCHYKITNTFIGAWFYYSRLTRIDPSVRTDEHW